MRSSGRLQPVRGRPRESRLRLLKLDLIVLTILLLVGLLVYLDRHPVRLGAAEPPSGRGATVAGVTEADVLLVLPPGPGENLAPTLDELDFAAVWIDILAQEVGPVRTTSLEELSPSTLLETAVAVVPRSVAREAGPTHVATFEQYVDGGGRLVVELPTAVWQPLVGPVGDPAEYRMSRRVTAFDGAVVRGELRDDTIQAPLGTLMAPVQVADVGALEDAEILMEIDGLPGFIRRPFGAGEVLVLHFDMARAIGLVQQGAPSVDWEVARPSLPLPRGFTRVAALVSDPRLRRSSAPVADLLERNVWSAVTAHRPLPRVWLFPNAYPGAFVMTHSGATALEAGRAMLDWELASNLPATVFAVGDQLGDVPEAQRDGAGLLLVPPTLDWAPAQRLGVLGVEPFERALGLEAQVEGAIEAGSGDVRLARMADGLWHAEYGQTFRVLAGLGVDVDSTYGPAWEPTDPEAASGYSFGTGLPFQPLDRNGLLLPLLEIPTLLNDGPGLDPEAALRLVDRAGRVYHQLVVVDWRADTMRRRPRAEVITTWRALYDAARERGMWITDLESVARFWRTRTQVRLQSLFSHAERRLSVYFESAAFAQVGDEVLAPSVAFEARYEDRTIERITCNGVDIPFAELGRTADGVFHIFAPAPGANQIEITYQGPIELE